MKIVAPILFTGKVIVKYTPDSQALRNIRLQRNLGLRQAAKMLKIRSTYLSGIERGEIKHISKNVYQRINFFYGGQPVTGREAQMSRNINHGETDICMNCEHCQQTLITGEDVFECTNEESDHCGHFFSCYHLTCDKVKKRTPTPKEG